MDMHLSTLLSSINIPVAIVCLFTALVAIYFLKSRSQRNLPPGPIAYPVIGNYDLVNKWASELHLLFHKLTEEYGEITSLYFGRNLFIILNSYDVIREAVIDQPEVFNDRSNNARTVDLDRVLGGKAHGVVTSSGEPWKKLRKMTITAFRDFGVGKKALEEQCQNEIRYLVEAFSEFNGKPFEVKDLLGNAVSNIICSIVFGERYDYDNDEFSQLLKTMDEQFKRGGFKRPAAHVPFLKIFFSNVKNADGFSRFLKLVEFVKERVSEHQKTYDENNIRDYIDLFIQTQKQEQESEEIYNDASLFITITQLFAAGSETTNTTLRWLIVHFLHNPQVQKKCFEELDKVIGMERPPVYRDRENTPYIMATIHELQRIANIAPFAVPHRCNADTTLRGYNIPNGTTVLLNTYSVHMNPKVWPEPHEFRPERWLDKDGQFYKHEQFIPFSIGRRFCMGEQLAKMELYLFVTMLIQSFEFLPVDDNHLPSLRGISGITLSPADFKVKAIRRE